VASKQIHASNEFGCSNCGAEVSIAFDDPRVASGVKCENCGHLMRNLTPHARRPRRTEIVDQLARDHKEDAPNGVWLQEETWRDICGRGRLRCRYCGEEPLIEDIDVFADLGLCGTCASAERRWAAE
jgi:DNA-directed RNA polymerase subunit RPC12/RpoP